MPILFEGTRYQYSMDGILKDNLDIAKSVIKKDWDMVFVVDGSEGSGKSVLTMQCAYFCDPTFNVDRVVFTPDDFKKTIMRAEKYQAVVYDEAYTGLSSRATMSLINRTLISMLAEIRQKNLFVFVVMPCFFDLDKYVALWRSRGLIHVYTDHGFKRGYFAFYNTDRKKSLYILGKKFYTYGQPKPNFHGKFTNFYPVDKDAYIQKKRDSLLGRQKIDEKAEEDKDTQHRLFQKLQENGKELTHEVKMGLLNLPSSTYYWHLRKFNGEKEL